MSVTVKRWYRSRKNQFIMFLIMTYIFYYISFNDYYYYNNVSLHREPVLDLNRRNSVFEYIEHKLQEALREDKGRGCDIPHLDPFAKEVMRFDKRLPKVTCKGKDWVKCYLSECRVVEEILSSTKDIVCTYQDIIYESDFKYYLEDPITVTGGDAYTLNKSDHVKINCSGEHENSYNIVGDGTPAALFPILTGKNELEELPDVRKIMKNNGTMDSMPFLFYKLKEDGYTKSGQNLSASGLLKSKWVGYSLGFRKSVERKPPPLHRKDTFNVLIFGFDSTSKNGFIRRMPKSYKYLTKVLTGTLLNGYNIVGDGTPAALFPILTGKNELELPDVRKKMRNNGSMDSMPFLFYKLKDDGYRTAYFEDMPWIGTFQYRFNGFRHQPADHYLRAFYLEESKGQGKGKKPRRKTGPNYCVGDTPRYQLMMNITDQFLKLDGKRFCFTFIADITHRDFNMISTADDAMVDFMKTLVQRDTFKDTLLIVMGDHGPRFAKVRDTLQGKLEERLPLMFIHLPTRLRSQRPHAAATLEGNKDALSTPHDVHATVLDVLGWGALRNTYRVAGADLLRGLSLLEPIPRNRSCSEAGIEPHWCACLAWKNVSEDDRMYQKTADALIDYINTLTEPMRAKCVPRALDSIKWVMRQHANSKMLSFLKAKDADGYVGKFGAHVKIAKENYQLKIVVDPGQSVYEASMIYYVREDRYVIDSRDISRTNAYGNEPSCISATHPHLNMYCYCKEFLNSV